VTSVLTGSWIYVGKSSRVEVLFLEMRVRNRSLNQPWRWAARIASFVLQERFNAPRNRIRYMSRIMEAGDCVLCISHHSHHPLSASRSTMPHHKHCPLAPVQWQGAQPLHRHPLSWIGRWRDDTRNHMQFRRLGLPKREKEESCRQRSCLYMRLFWCRSRGFNFNKVRGDKTSYILCAHCARISRLRESAP